MIHPTRHINNVSCSDASFPSFSFFTGFPHLSPGEAWMALFSPESFGLTGLVWRYHFFPKVMILLLETIWTPQIYEGILHWLETVEIATGRLMLQKSCGKNSSIKITLQQNNMEVEDRLLTSRGCGKSHDGIMYEILIEVELDHFWRISFTSIYPVSTPSPWRDSMYSSSDDMLLFWVISRKWVVVTNEGLVRNPLTKHAIVQVVTITGKEDNLFPICMHEIFAKEPNHIPDLQKFVVMSTRFGLTKIWSRNQCQFKRDWQPLNSKKVAADCSWILLTCCRLFQVYIYIYTVPGAVSFIFGGCEFSGHERITKSWTFFFLKQTLSVFSGKNLLRSLKFFGICQ